MWTRNKWIIFVQCTVLIEALRHSLIRNGMSTEKASVKVTETLAKGREEALKNWHWTRWFRIFDD